MIASYAPFLEYAQGFIKLREEPVDEHEATRDYVLIPIQELKDAGLLNPKHSIDQAVPLRTGYELHAWALSGDPRLYYKLMLYIVCMGAGAPSVGGTYFCTTKNVRRKVNSMVDSSVMAYEQHARYWNNKP